MKIDHLAYRGLVTLGNARLAFFVLGASLFITAHAEERTHQNQESKIFVYGVATNSCGKLVEDLKLPNGWVGYSSWLNGYLTGVNVYNSHAPRRDGRRDIRKAKTPQRSSAVPSPAPGAQSSSARRGRGRGRSSASPPALRFPDRP